MYFAKNTGGRFVGYIFSFHVFYESGNPDKSYLQKPGVLRFLFSQKSSRPKTPYIY